MLLPSLHLILRRGQLVTGRRFSPGARTAFSSCAWRTARLQQRERGHALRLRPGRHRRGHRRVLPRHRRRPLSSRLFGNAAGLAPLLADRRTAARPLRPPPRLPKRPLKRGGGRRPRIKRQPSSSLSSTRRSPACIPTGHRRVALRGSSRMQGLPTNSGGLQRPLDSGLRGIRYWMMFQTYQTVPGGGTSTSNPRGRRNSSTWWTTASRLGSSR